MVHRFSDGVLFCRGIDWRGYSRYATGDRTPSHRKRKVSVDGMSISRNNTPIHCVPSARRGLQYRTEQCVDIMGVIGDVQPRAVTSRFNQNYLTERRNDFFAEHEADLLGRRSELRIRRRSRAKQGGVKENGSARTDRGNSERGDNNRRLIPSAAIEGCQRNYRGLQRSPA